MTKHILLVDDDALLRRSLSFSLEQEGYRVSTASSAEDAFNLARRDRPDLFLLDIGLPGMDGLQALQTIQQEFAAPVIFLTARRRHLDEILGLELGAQDYISKPFDTGVLIARIRAVLRKGSDRQPANESRQSIELGDLWIDPEAHTASIGGVAIDLTPREFALLHVLALNAGRVLSVDDLLASIWGAEFAGESQVVYVHIRWLREKIEVDPSHPRRIVTVRGIGYRLEMQL